VLDKLAHIVLAATGAIHTRLGSTEDRKNKNGDQIDEGHKALCARPKKFTDRGRARLCKGDKVMQAHYYLRHKINRGNSAGRVTRNCWSNPL
jgi:hypothetical protein